MSIEITKTMPECAECGDEKEEPFYPDHREPPMDIGDCLCGDCFSWTAREHIEQLQVEIDSINEELKNYEAETNQ